MLISFGIFQKCLTYLSFCCIRFTLICCFDLFCYIGLIFFCIWYLRTILGPKRFQTLVAYGLVYLYRQNASLQARYSFFFRDDASKKSENGKSLENLKIENTRLLRWGRKNPTVLSYVRSYFCDFRAIRKSCFGAFHMPAVIMRSLNRGDSWLCLLCRLFQPC